MFLKSSAQTFWVEEKKFHISEEFALYIKGNPPQMEYNYKKYSKIQFVRLLMLKFSQNFVDDIRSALQNKLFLKSSAQTFWVEEKKFHISEEFALYIKGNPPQMEYNYKKYSKIQFVRLLMLKFSQNFIYDIRSALQNFFKKVQHKIFMG